MQIDNDNDTPHLVPGNTPFILAESNQISRSISINCEMHPVIEQTELDRKYPFLTREYLEDALGEAAQNCTVVNFTVRRALSKGENFASDILRIQLNLRCENGDERWPKKKKLKKLINEVIFRTKTFIMKVALVTEGMSDMLEEYDVFFREIVFYSKILPEIKEISKELEYNGKLAPE